MIPIQKHERYAPLAAEINQLGIALGKVQSRLCAVEASLQSELNRPRISDDASHVQAALSFAAGGPVVRPAPAIESLNEERLVLKQQEEALRKTIDARTKALYRVESELSVGLHDEIALDHRRLAGRYLQKLLELDAMHDEEEELFRQIEANGYSVRFPEMVRSQTIGTLKEVSSSAIWHRVRDLRHYAK